MTLNLNLMYQYLTLLQYLLLNQLSTDASPNQNST